MREVKIVVTPQAGGGAKIEAFGFKGDACLKATKSLEEVLGLMKDRQPKPEMFEKPLHGTETVGSG